MQREHGALSGTTDEHQSQGQRYHCRTTFQQCHFTGLEGVSSGIITVNKDTDQETQVGKAGDDERLLACSHSRRLRIVETDEQIRRNTHQFPEQIHLEDIGSHHQSQHGHGKEAEKCIITLESALTFHVAERVHMYHQRHGGDDDKHHHGNRVEQDTQVNAQRLGEGQPRHIIRH